jgi:putative ATPase
MLVARRLVVHSSEDVGMADPNALVVASSAMYVLEKTGYPEGLIPLSNAIVYVCEAPKSNSVVTAFHAAQNDAKNIRDDDGVPPYLKDNSFGSIKDKANSANYKYPHDYPNGYVEQQYLPDKLKDKVYYTPSDYGFETKVKEIRKLKGKK